MYIVITKEDQIGERVQDTIKQSSKIHSDPHHFLIKQIDYEPPLLSFFLCSSLPSVDIKYLMRGTVLCLWNLTERILNI